MKLGVNILNFGPGTDPASLRSWVRFAEQSGFALAMISDHVALTPDVNTVYPAPFYDPFTTLAWLAGLGGDIRLGTTVAILPYRDPLLTARMGANIDQFSGGRFVFGVGVGWSALEYAALGVPFERRGAITDDYLAAIRKLWTADVASVSSEFASFQEVHTGPRPAQAPHPPIWVGGSSRSALRRAVTFGDAWHPLNAQLSWLRTEGVGGLRSAARAAGRPVPALCPRMALQLTDAPMDEDERMTGQGSRAQVLSDLAGFAELGAEYLVLDTYAGLPSGRRPVVEDQRTLEALAADFLG